MFPLHYLFLFFVLAQKSVVMMKAGVMTVVFNAALHAKLLELSCASDNIEGLTKMFLCLVCVCAQGTATICSA